MLGDRGYNIATITLSALHHMNENTASDDLKDFRRKSMEKKQ